MLRFQILIADFFFYESTSSNFFISLGHKRWIFSLLLPSQKQSINDAIAASRPNGKISSYLVSLFSKNGGGILCTFSILSSKQGTCAVAKYLPLENRLSCTSKLFSSAPKRRSQTLNITLEKFTRNKV